RWPEPGGYSVPAGRPAAEASANTWPGVAGTILKSVSLCAEPEGLVTEMGPVVAPVGTVALIVEEERMVNGPLTPLNMTSVTESRFEPLRLTREPAMPPSGEKLE